MPEMSVNQNTDPGLSTSGSATPRPLLTPRPSHLNLTVSLSGRAEPLHSDLNPILWPETHTSSNEEDTEPPDVLYRCQEEIPMIVPFCTIGVSGQPRTFWRYNLLHHMAEMHLRDDGSLPPIPARGARNVCAYQSSRRNLDGN